MLKTISVGTSPVQLKEKKNVKELIFQAVIVAVFSLAATAAITIFTILSAMNAEGFFQEEKHSETKGEKKEI